MSITVFLQNNTTLRRSDQGAHIRERLTANQFDLNLQGAPNQHGTQKPRRTPRTNLSPPRLELQNYRFISWLEIARYSLAIAR